MAKARETKGADGEVLGVTRSGMVITEELAEQWATEIESEDFEPTHCKVLYVGPPLLGQSDTGPGVAFPLSSEELDSLRTRAQEEGRPLEDLIREALDS